MNEQEVNEIVYGLYDEGFLDGQFAMIKSIEKLGLITGAMADMIRGVLFGDVKFTGYFSNEGAALKAKQATEKILKLMDPEIIKYGGYVEINELSELKPPKE